MYGFTEAEIKIFRRLNTPQKIQNYLNKLAINFESDGDTCMSPRLVLKTKKAHCLEGALFAACALSFHGYKPLILDLRPEKPDEAHVLAVFKERGHFGAITKTNHAVLRFRDPIYKTIRELVMSYFHEYFLDNGKKMLRDYSLPVDLSRFNKHHWQTDEKGLFYISKYLDKVKHYDILTKHQIKTLRLADPIEIRAGKLVEWKLAKNRIVKKV